jgi:hypothetical protein
MLSSGVEPATLQYKEVAIVQFFVAVSFVTDSQLHHLLILSFIEQCELEVARTMY